MAASSKFGSKLLFVFAFCFLFVLCRAKSCHMIDACSCNCDGEVYDITKFSGSDQSNPTFQDVADQQHQGLSYTYNGCKGVNVGPNCVDVALCGVAATPGAPPILANYGERNPDWDWNSDMSCPRISYPAPLASAGKSWINVICDETAKTPSMVNTGSSMMGLYFDLKSSDACPHKGGGGGGSGGGSGGLSVGSVLVIVFVALLVVYAIGGVAFMMIRHKGEGRYVPQSEFWKGLPSNIKAGVVFTYSATLGRFVGKKANYDDI